MTATDPRPLNGCSQFVADAQAIHVEDRTWAVLRPSASTQVIASGSLFCFRRHFTLFSGADLC